MGIFYDFRPRPAIRFSGPKVATTQFKLVFHFPLSNNNVSLHTAGARRSNMTDSSYDISEEN